MIDATTIDKANAAKRLMNDPDYQLIIAAIEEDVFANFKAVPIGETDKLMNIHSLSHGLKLVTDRIAKYIELARFEAQRDLIEDDQ